MSSQRFSKDRQINHLSNFGLNGLVRTIVYTSAEYCIVENG